MSPFIVSFYLPRNNAICVAQQVDAFARRERRDG